MKVWTCSCGKVELAQPDYAVGDREPCVRCEGGTAHVVALLESAHVDAAGLAVLDAVVAEMAAADAKHGPRYASMHEAYGVLVEEVEEFFDEVRLKQSERSPAALRKELVQVAAVAIHAARQVTTFGEAR